MFSGIIEELGTVKRVLRRGRIILFEIKAAAANRDIKIGDSIAVNGTCLTLIANKDGLMSFEAMPKTLNDTNLGILKAGDPVNLERALKIGDRLSGHFVSGHVDCVGIIRKKTLIEGNTVFQVAVPMGLIKRVNVKDSIAVDGISLTIQGIRANIFSVYLIPLTLKNTTFSLRGPSDKVNIEFDILTKAAIRL